MDAPEDAEEEEEAVSLADNEAERLPVLVTLGEGVADAEALGERELESDGDPDLEIDFDPDFVGDSV
jgi:hypothetical protein